VWLRSAPHKNTEQWLTEQRTTESKSRYSREFMNFPLVPWMEFTHDNSRKSRQYALVLRPVSLKGIKPAMRNDISRASANRVANLDLRSQKRHDRINLFLQNRGRCNIKSTWITLDRYSSLD
jgi:hypothetical protein